MQEMRYHKVTEGKNSKPHNAGDEEPYDLKNKNGKKIEPPAQQAYPI